MWAKENKIQIERKSACHNPHDMLFLCCFQCEWKRQIWHTILLTTLSMRSSYVCKQKWTGVICTTKSWVVVPEQAHCGKHDIQHVVVLIRAHGHFDIYVDLYIDIETWYLTLRRKRSVHNNFSNLIFPLKYIISARLKTSTMKIWHTTQKKFSILGDFELKKWKMCTRTS